LDDKKEVAPAADAPAPPTPSRRGDTQERIRVAAADAADAAEQRAIQEILALEEALARARSEAATKVAELEQRLVDSEERASAAERHALDAHAKVTELERHLAAANERAQRLRAAKPVMPPPAVEPRPAPTPQEADEARLAAELRLRTEELEREREEKIRLIEESDRRLAGIEEGAADAAQQMTAAEAELAQEAERLRSETERAREEAQTTAARVGDLERELERARNEALAAAGGGAETSAEERITAVTVRIVRLAWRAWTRWGAPLVASLRSLIRSATRPR